MSSFWSERISAFSCWYICFLSCLDFCTSEVSKDFIPSLQLQHCEHFSARSQKFTYWGSVHGCDLQLKRYRKMNPGSQYLFYRGIDLHIPFLPCLWLSVQLSHLQWIRSMRKLGCYMLCIFIHKNKSFQLAPTYGSELNSLGS